MSKDMIMAFISLLIFSSLNAQIDLEGKLKSKVKKRVKKKIDNALDKGLDKTEETIENSVSKKTLKIRKVKKRQIKILQQKMTHDLSIQQNMILFRVKSRYLLMTLAGTMWATCRLDGTQTTRVKP